MIKIIKKIGKDIKALFRYPKISAVLSKKNQLYFFSYSWSFGGGERVFVDMLNAFKDKSPICFVTGISVTDGFKDEFKRASEAINLDRWAKKKILKRFLLRKMAHAINAQEAPTIVGWSSEFMYELIPLMAQHVTVIDITHNFTDNGKGLEFKTLTHVPRIDRRIVVSKGLLQQFSELYKVNNINSKYLERISFIRNKIPFDHSLPEKHYQADLQVVFVARNSPEKRSHIFIRVAEMCKDLNLPVIFKMIGDYDSKQLKAPKNVEILGVMNNKHAINKHYENSHMLLLTSERESWGLVVFEAMNFGVVPICTNVGDLNHYIGNENGVLIQNTADNEQLAERFTIEIKRFCEDRTLLKRYSIGAFNTLSQLVETSDFEKEYRQVILGDL